MRADASSSSNLENFNRKGLNCFHSDKDVLMKQGHLVATGVTPSFVCVCVCVCYQLSTTLRQTVTKTENYTVNMRRCFTGAEVEIIIAAAGQCCVVQVCGKDFQNKTKQSSKQFSLPFYFSQ